MIKINRKKFIKKWPRNRAIRPTVNFSPRRADPSQLATPRRAFLYEIQKHFTKLQKEIIDLFKEVVIHPTVNAKWEFETSEQKLKSFQIWLQDKLQDTSKDWYSKYIISGYNHGAKLALDKYISKTPLTKEKQDSLRSSFGRPIPTTKVNLLASRVLTGLNGITDDLSMKLTRALTDGLIQGHGPQQIAREMVKTTGMSKQRAKMMARTELQYAHAEGTLDSLEDLGLNAVTAEVELSSVEDQRRCPKCAMLDGKVYTIKRARGVLPIHPSCRCNWLPVV